MTPKPPNKGLRNVLFGVLLLALTFLLIGNRLGGLFGESDSGNSSADYATFEDSEISDQDDNKPTPPPPPALDSDSDSPPPPTETTSMTFLEFAVQYRELSENFRGRDSLVALVVNRRAHWEGYVRNVTRHTTSFYVTLWSAESYNGPSASMTFDHDMEDELYALQPNDFVRFSGLITRAAGSVGMEGESIEVIERATE